MPLPHLAKASLIARAQAAFRDHFRCRRVQPYQDVDAVASNVTSAIRTRSCDDASCANAMARCQGDGAKLCKLLGVTCTLR